MQSEGTGGVNYRVSGVFLENPYQIPAEGRLGESPPGTLKNPIIVGGICGWRDERLVFWGQLNGGTQNGKTPRKTHLAKWLTFKPLRELLFRIIRFDFFPWSEMAT